MKIKLNPDQEIVQTIREGLKRTGGYCPCRVERTEETKCMCKEFKDQIADPNYEGFCHCMLYYKSLQDLEKRRYRTSASGKQKIAKYPPGFFQQARRVAYCALAKNTVYW